MVMFQMTYELCQRDLIIGVVESLGRKLYKRLKIIFRGFSHKWEEEILACSF